jgi:hypothetical protein
MMDLSVGVARRWAAEFAGQRHSIRDFPGRLSLWGPRDLLEAFHKRLLIITVLTDITSDCHVKIV